MAEPPPKNDGPTLAVILFVYIRIYIRIYTDVGMYIFGEIGSVTRELEVGTCGGGNAVINIKIGKKVRIRGWGTGAGLKKK